MAAPSAFSAPAAQRAPSADLDGARDGSEPDRSNRSLSLEASPSLERARWRSAITRVSRANSFSRSFKTLRDMTGESYIDENRLKRVRQIGSGTFAKVYLCEMLPEPGHDTPSVKVAVKRIHSHLLRERRELEAFVNEAKLLRKLRHPNIVNFIGVSGDADRLTQAKDPSNSSQRSSSTPTSASVNTSLVQEYLDGGTLKKRLLQQMTTVAAGQRRKYSDEEALGWMIQVAEGLNYLHTANPCVIHRDLKLENVVMRKLQDGSMQLCLCDFGLSVLVRLQPGARKVKALPTREEMAMAIRMNSIMQLTMQVDARLLQHQNSGGRKKPRAYVRTSSGASCEPGKFNLTGRTGSFFYMAPETVLSKPSNEKVDVFAFGLMLYEMFTYTMTSAIVMGPKSASDKRAAELYALKVAKGYRRPIPENWPQQLQSLITDCWEGEAQDRPSMEEVLQRLKEMQADQVFHKPASQGCAGCACTIM